MSTSFSDPILEPTPSNNHPHLSLWLVLVLIAGFVLAQIPYVNWVFGPINTFVTAVHEMSHAAVCLITGGQVSGMTIVSDGHGHGGLTFCRGGMSLLYTPAGYLGTTFVGCSLIAAARNPKLSRGILGFIGVALGVATLFFMTGTIFQQWRIMEGLGSMFWGLVLSGFFLFAAFKMSDRSANLILLFVAVQTALNAVQGVIYLMTSSFGGDAGHWSDATNMAMRTGIPAFVWGFSWAAISLVMVGLTMWWTLHNDFRKR